MWQTVCGFSAFPVTANLALLRRAFIPWSIRHEPVKMSLPEVNHGVRRACCEASRCTC